jgi:pimeloyl-ACP methyl ester carboxylesterase
MSTPPPSGKGTTIRIGFVGYCAADASVEKMNVRTTAEKRIRAPLFCLGPGARRATIEKTAHVPSMERPEEFEQLVLGFIEEAA